MTAHRLLLYEHPFASYCWKALIALDELELPFEARIVEGDAGREELALLWPPASIPVLRDETAGLTIPESSTIVEYLDAGRGRLLPHHPGMALQARLWDRVIDGSVATPMQAIVADALRPADRRDPYGVQQAGAALDRAYVHLDAHLADRDWLAGPEFTLADCAAAPALFYARAVRPWDEGRLEGLTRYYRALMHRPSVARTIAEAVPYRDLFPLPWPHDVDAHRPVA